MNKYIKFLLNQFKGWHKADYIFFEISFAIQYAILILNKFTIANFLTFLGINLGVLCIISINKAKSVNAWLGVLSGLCLIVTAAVNHHYLAIAKQIAYIVTLDLPIIFNSKWNHDMDDHIRKLNINDWIRAIGFTIAVFIFSSLLFMHVPSESLPIYDGLNFALSLAGGIICVLRFRDQYYWWFAGSLAASVLWAVTYIKTGSTSAIEMLVNNLIYLANDIMAFKSSPWFNNNK